MNQMNINKTARIGGILYLIIILTGMFGELFVRDKLIVSLDATASAANIMANQFLFRLGIAGDLIMHVCDVPLLVVIYILLRPVNKYLALTAVAFNLVQSAVLVASKLSLLNALFFLSPAEYLKAFEPQQLYALMYHSLKLEAYGFAAGLIFFGCACLIIGYLVVRSEYLPKAIGVMMQIAGVCYLINSFAMLLAPKLAAKLFPPILVPAFIAEVSLCLWLIFKGVNIETWGRKSGFLSA